MRTLYYSLLAKRLNINDKDMQFAYGEYRRLFKTDETVIRLGRRARRFLPVGELAAPIVLAEIKDALETRRRFSLVRVGNGEGNAVSMLRPLLHPAIVKAFYTEFCSQNGLAAPLKSAVEFCSVVRDALGNADVKGFRLIRFNDNELIKDGIRHNDLYTSLGLIYARSFFYDELRKGHCSESTVTNAWIHLDLVPLLPELLKCAQNVIVITGRSELEGKFRERLGGKLTDFLRVPVQGFVPADLEESHFPKRYNEVRNILRHRTLEGVLVLVGAGLFGKVYCYDVRKAGGVAVDLGSAFDLLAGVVSRPIHNQVDANSFRW